MLHGTVVSLHRWPVKSMGGEQVDALVVDGRGAAGDRTHALYDVHQDASRRLTARQASRMLRWSARYPDVAPDALDPDDPPLPHLTAPDGAGPWRWDDPALPGALAADLGRSVTLRRDVTGQQDLGGTVLLTTAATHAAVEDVLGDLDLRRWRTNVHVRLDGVPAYAEEDWEGGSMEIGGVPFTFLHPCVRCVIPTRDPDTAERRPEILRWITRARSGLFGMNARPTARGVLRVGDTVTIAPPGR
ncbi:MOSC domain-containing protein [Paraconexibacter algicola]|uniref:Fe-S protein n=1 Tax=Paraconexibacter algicola TaxID=2133960 RepID=A0A2T4UJL9_9ACTN|nr:MOSC N-terminal beta barrel domain-containing protein [Paraconexibacter algicola]PTL59420.1 Fe-S protein [Paraconexibacter algicola]